MSGRKPALVATPLNLMSSQKRVMLALCRALQSTRWPVFFR